jgi:hypothetical protein
VPYCGGREWFDFLSGTLSFPVETLHLASGICHLAARSGKGLPIASVTSFLIAA